MFKYYPDIMRTQGYSGGFNENRLNRQNNQIKMEIKIPSR
jgi:hypothetical protein